jgi:hypothetical protein
MALLRECLQAVRALQGNDGPSPISNRRAKTASSGQRSTGRTVDRPGRTIPAVNGGPRGSSPDTLRVPVNEQLDLHAEPELR